LVRMFLFYFYCKHKQRIMSNQNAQIQRKYTKRTEHKRVHYAKCVKKQWSSQGCAERHLYSCFLVIPLFLLMCIYPLTSPPKHILLRRFPLPRFPPLSSGAAFSTPAFSTLVIWCHIFHSRVFSAPGFFDSIGLMLT